MLVRHDFAGALTRRLPKTLRILLVPVLASLASLAFGAASTAEEPPAPQDVTDESDLPRGAGIAAAFPADRGIASHPAVIFAEDFEKEGYRERWDEARDRDGEVLDIVDESASGAPVGRGSLRVKATLGRNTGGGLTRWFEPPQALFIRFYTKFDADCDYLHHFVTLRANRGLRGGDRWSGFGGAGELPEGDRRFSTALEPWGNRGRWPPPGRWNFYSYWHEMRKSGDGKYWGNGFRPERQEDIRRGRWICCEFMLRHNTPGKRDGEQAFWIDGELRGHWKGISWRSSERLRANALTLESYVTDRWTKQPVNIVFFDNVVVAGKYIGPTGRAAPAWADAMREVHRRFRGEEGSFAQLGDSITVSRAFWSNLRHGRKNAPPEMVEAYEVVSGHMLAEGWDGKGPARGNDGGKTIRWAEEKVGEWLETLNPEVAVLMFGTNDLGSFELEEYEARLRRVVERCLENGTVVILSTIPPRSGFAEKAATFAEAARRVARDLRVPLTDYHAAIIERRPQDWDGSLEKFSAYGGYDVPTLIARDGVHPSNPKEHQGDYSAEALSKNGYGLRSYLVLLKYAEVIRHALVE